MNQAASIAKLLLEIKAVSLNVAEPFVYTSGIRSPIYCDNRLIISYPEKRHLIVEGFLRLIEKNALKFDVVAGTATAGIPHAAWIADRLQKPMVYVRGKAKGHGKHNKIEGKIKAGQTALVIEDLISTGGSSIDAALALRDTGATVNDCLAIFSYELEKAKKNFADNSVTLHSLSNFPTLIDVACDEGYISAEEKQTAATWQHNPDTWNNS